MACKPNDEIQRKAYKRAGVRRDKRLIRRGDFRVFIRIVREKPYERNCEVWEKIVEKPAPRRDDVRRLHELEKGEREAHDETFSKPEKVTVYPERQDRSEGDRAARRHAIERYERQSERSGETHRRISQFASGSLSHDSAPSFDQRRDDRESRARRDYRYEQQENFPPFCQYA